MVLTVALGPWVALAVQKQNLKQVERHLSGQVQVAVLRLVPEPSVLVVMADCLTHIAASEVLVEQ